MSYHWNMFFFPFFVSLAVVFLRVLPLSLCLSPLVSFVLLFAILCFFAAFLLQSDTQIHLCHSQMPAKSISQHSSILEGHCQVWHLAAPGTYLYAFTHICRHFHSLSPTQLLKHREWFTQTLNAPRRHTKHLHTQHSKWWFTTSLFSNVLLASSLPLPFVTTDRPCNSIYPSHLYPHSVSPRCFFFQPDLIPFASFLP